ncbi:MAG: hypothetical protein M3N68_03865 [Actinomycetota bacterium]|nr:hypothetical protein [Actinomycetota bacterium]
MGEDIEPGRYRSAGGDLCYWATLKGTSGEFSDIIANNLEPGAQIVTIGPNVAYFETSGCEVWKKG